MHLRAVPRLRSFDDVLSSCYGWDQEQAPAKPARRRSVLGVFDFHEGQRREVCNCRGSEGALALARIVSV